MSAIGIAAVAVIGLVVGVAGTLLVGALCRAADAALNAELNKLNAQMRARRRAETAAWVKRQLERKP